jgi:sec-independent protein translocase protein TatA
MFGLGAPELIVILIILLLLFGGTKLPQLSKAIGQSLREIRKGAEDPISESDQTPKQRSPLQTANKSEDSQTPPVS